MAIDLLLDGLGLLGFVGGGGGGGGGGDGGGGIGGVFRPMVCVNMNSDLPMMGLSVWVTSIQMAVAIIAADATK